MKTTYTHNFIAWTGMSQDISAGLHVAARTAQPVFGKLHVGCPQDMTRI